MDHLENSSDNSLAVLYTISDDPKRKEFLDELVDFMVQNATPILRVPIMGRQPLDLYELYRQVVDRGGLLRVIQHKLWREVRDTLGLPATITSAAYTLRTQYWRHLYPFECHKHDFSQPHEVEEAIERNQRDVAPANDNGPFDTMSTQHPMFPGFSAMQHPNRFLPHPAFFGPSGHFSPYAPYPAFNPPPFGAGSLPYGYTGPVMPGPSHGLLPNPFAARYDVNTARPPSKKKASSTVTSSDDPTPAASDNSDSVDSVGMARDTRSGNGASVGNVTPADHRSTPGNSASSTDRSPTGGSLASAERGCSSVESVHPIDLRATGGSVAAAVHRGSAVDNVRPVDRGAPGESIASGSAADRASDDDSVARPSADSVERSSRDDVGNGTSNDDLPGTSGISSNDAASEAEADGGAVGEEETRKRPRPETSPTQENTSAPRQVFSFDLMGWEADTDDGTMVLRLRINGVRYRGLVNLERDDDNDDDGL